MKFYFPCLPSSIIELIIEDFTLYFQYSFSGEYNVDPDGSYSGDKPFLVQCLFPDNTTIIGEEVDIEIEKCIAEQCYEVPINYTMPVEQMKNIFAISGRCTQTLDFHCKTAPLQVIFISVPF